jgi:hypothetical protein
MAIGILIAFIVGVIMGFDAHARGMNGWLWGFLIFAFMIVFLPVYLMIRKPRINR